MNSRPNWDKYFMDIAEVVKTRSSDPKTQVGAVLVSMKDHRIISTGYNSLCSGMNDNEFNWNDRENVKLCVTHAETNCLLYSQSKFEDTILYCTLSPCKDCVKLLSATHVRKVIYKDEYRDFETSKKLCEFFKIELIKFS